MGAFPQANDSAVESGQTPDAEVEVKNLKYFPSEAQRQAFLKNVPNENTDLLQSQMSLGMGKS